MNNGKPVTMLDLCRTSPEQAARRIEGLIKQVAELQKESKVISLALSLPSSNESSKQQSRIAELEKERDEHMAHAYYILETCMVFSPAHFEAHNLEQQAKGVSDFVSSIEGFSEGYIQALKEGKQ